jgi:outer membrane protein assembly factor BamB
VARTARHRVAVNGNPPLEWTRAPHRFVVMAIDRRTGKTIWERTANEALPHESSHPDNGTWASASATTDGEHVIASFDSFGYYAYDMNGTLVWQKDLGDKRMRNEFGEGSTPALHGNHLVVVWDHFVPGASFITALDKRTGQELWRAKRDEIDTWATPLIVEHNGSRASTRCSRRRSAPRGASISPIAPARRSCSRTARPSR